MVLDRGNPKLAFTVRNAAAEVALRIRLTLLVPVLATRMSPVLGSYARASGPDPTGTVPTTVWRAAERTVTLS
jgi:hypothetical protein